MEYEFTMQVRIDNAESLYAAAKNHPDNPGDEYLRPNGEIDIEACLITIIDPGHVPGCSVHNSSAEQV